MTTPNSNARASDPGHPDAGNIHQGHSGKALAAAWTAVILMILGFGLVTLALPVESARLPLLITGGVIGLTGIITGAAGGIMNTIE